MALMLNRPQPYRELNRWVAGGPRWLDEILEGFFDAPAVRDMEKMFHAQIDVKEGKDGLAVYVDLPGVNEKDLNIALEGNRLMISGERKSESKEGLEGGWHFERRFGRFERAVTLPVDVDAEKVSATFKDGVLEVMLPKAPQAKGRSIQIKPHS